MPIFGRNPLAKLPSAKLREINERWKNGEFIDGFDPNFGWENEEASETTIDDRIVGSWYNCPEAGIGVSISAYLRWYYQGTKAKFGLYKRSDKSFVAGTQEATKASADGYVTEWVTANFAVGASLLNVDYFIVVWADNVGMIRYVWDVVDKSGYSSEVYDGFPGTWEPSMSQHKCSIFCTYSIVAPPVVPVGGNVQQARILDIAAVKREQIKSFGSRFPKHIPRVIR